MCLNLEWMFCALTGKLGGGGGHSGGGLGGGELVFSLAPSRMDTRPFSHDSYARPHSGCGDYAENDVYYLEVCALNELCSNREELFRLKAGESFRCRSDAAGLARLRVALLEARR